MKYTTHFFPLFLFIALGCSRSNPRVVVACAQDREFAEGIFSEFEKTAKLTVSAKYDTEANKSVSLAAELEAEASRPRCDVHWNNEIIASIRLARKGIYAKYQSPNAEPFPAWAKAKDGTWQAFAARARVLVINTNLVPETNRPTSILNLTDPKWKSKIAIAKPLYGTTATQAACLFEVLGSDAAKDFFRGLTTNDVAVVAGNKQVAVDVAAGRFAMGLTDTDDAIIELNNGKPVALVYLDRDGNSQFSRLGVLFILRSVSRCLMGRFLHDKRPTHSAVVRISSHRDRFGCGIKHHARHHSDEPAVDEQRCEERFPAERHSISVVRRPACILFHPHRARSRSLEPASIPAVASRRLVQRARSWRRRIFL